MAVLPNLKDVLKVKGGDLTQIKLALRHLAEKEVLVGFPEDTTKRDDMDITGMTNAALGYIHNTGMPEENIPQREFMESGIKDGKAKITEQLSGVAKRILRDRSLDVAVQGLHRVGVTAMLALKKKINEGVPPPLADRTLQERIRKGAKSGQKSAKKELERRAQGLAPSTEFAKPLIDSGALRNSISYVIRNRKDRK